MKILACLRLLVPILGISLRLLLRLRLLLLLLPLTTAPVDEVLRGFGHLA